MGTDGRTTRVNIVITTCGCVWVGLVDHFIISDNNNNNLDFSRSILPQVKRGTSKASRHDDDATQGFFYLPSFFFRA